MKRKILATLLAAAMTVSALAGCGGKTADSNAPKEDSGSEAVETPAEDAADSEADTVPVEDNSEVVELEFWGWWSSESIKPHITKMVEDFNASQS